MPVEYQGHEQIESLRNLSAGENNVFNVTFSSISPHKANSNMCVPLGKTVG